MKKLAVVMSVSSSATALKVMAIIKNKLGQTKRTRVMFTDNGKLTFVSGVAQKSVREVYQLDKYKACDVLILPVYGDDTQVQPSLAEIKMYLNTALGFSIYICAVPDKEDADMLETAETVVDIVKSNLGI